MAAGLAQRVRGTDRKGKACWKIDKRDERGRTFDIHAFRTTFNSLLAAAGVPLTTRRILMRHAAEGVPDGHYADTKLIDLRGALHRLPALPLDGQPERQAQSATRTDNATGNGEYLLASTRLYPRQLQREIERSSAPSGSAQPPQRRGTNRLNPCQYRNKANTREVVRRGEVKRASGFEPTTSSLGTWRASAVSTAVTM